MDDDFQPEDKDLRIHMEAVTDDPQLMNRNSPLADSGKPNSHPPSPTAQQGEDTAPMRLVLRSPGMNDLKIKAKPKTFVSKLISEKLKKDY